MVDKDESARELIASHFAVDPDLRVVYRIITDNEESSDEPIKLLEVNAATIASGSVDVFGFGPSQDVPFRVQIALVTPAEFEALRSDPSSLPPGWDLARALVFERPSHVDVLDVVALLEDVPERALIRGQVGTVVEQLGHDAFEVEFSDDDGRAYAQVTLPVHSLLVLHHQPVRAA